MFLVADASQREELAKQFLTRLPLTEDHAEWRVVLNAIELLIQQGNQEVNNSPVRSGSSCPRFPASNDTCSGHVCLARAVRTLFEFGK